MKNIRLKKDKEKSILRFHPWIFSGAVAHFENLEEADLIRVLDYQGNYLATAYYQKETTIFGKIISFEDQPIDANFWLKKIKDAFLLREKLGIYKENNNTIFRLINGESDGFPGLVADFYAGVLVLQCHTVFMHGLLKTLIPLFQEVFGEKLIAIYDKSKATLENTQNQYLYKKKQDTLSCIALENQIPFFIDWENGQKTGFFIDQKDNRQLLFQYAKDKKVLNTFCYSGGFSLYALHGGAEKVVSVDASAQALSILEKNLSLSPHFSAQHTSIQMDVNDFFRNNKEKFDIIVLDPPAFAKKISARHKGLQGYIRLNIAAMKQLEKGGLLFTFSCSQAIDHTLFEGIVRAAAIELKKEIKILHRMSAPLDHPVSIFYPEGSYLKGLVLWIS